MRGILDSNICYEFVATSEVPPEDIRAGDFLMSDRGPMYFTGESIYLGRNGKWIKIEVSDIKLMIYDQDGRLYLVMKYTIDGSNVLEIKLDSTKRSHLTALRYVLTLYEGVVDMEVV